MTLKNSPVPADSPGSSPGTIYRDLLVRKMKRLSARKNLFITAPGGYGKTVAARQWLTSARGAAARLTAEPEDHRPGVFYKRLATALTRLVKFETALPDTELSLDAFLDALSRLPEKRARCYLLIDDLHRIQNDAVLNSLPRIAARMPEYICLCLSGRSWPSQRLLDTGLFAVLTQDDLRFSAEEVEWLGAEKDLALTPEQIQSLLDATGGWAVYLSALLSGEPEGQTPKMLTQYLETRVWAGLDSEVRLRLCQLSVPSEITRELCQRIVGRRDGLELPERLIQTVNPYLFPTDSGAYRFDGQFRAFLQARASMLGASMLGANELRKLHQTVAQWYYELGDLAESAKHCVQTGDFRGLYRCILASGRYRAQHKPITAEFYTQILRPYFESPMAPAETPYGLYVRSVAAVLSGRPEEAFRHMDLLRQTQTDVIARHPELAKTLLLTMGLDSRATLREYYTGLGQRPPSLSAAAAKADSRVPSLTLRLPFAHRSARDYSEFFELREDDLALMTNTWGILAGEDFPVLRPSLIAGLCYERGELLEAARHALGAVHACDSATHPEIRFCANMILAAILYAMGAVRDAESVMTRTKRFVTDAAPFLAENFKALQTARAIRTGHTDPAGPADPAGLADTARAWLEEHASHAGQEPLPLYPICRYFTTLRAYIASEEYAAAAELGKRLQTLSAEYGRPLDQIESGLLTAIALWRHGKKSGAARQMGRALQIAAPYGFIQLFVDEGRDLLPLLLTMRQGAGLSASLAPFADRLLTRLCGEHHPAAAGPPPRLSAMRRRMLEYLDRGLSYKEIAEETGLVHGTVKIHVHLLYKQLGVHSAEEAIIKAKMQGLLE